MLTRYLKNIGIYVQNRRFFVKNVILDAYLSKKENLETHHLVTDYFTATTATNNCLKSVTVARSNCLTVATVPVEKFQVFPKISALKAR